MSLQHDPELAQVAGRRCAAAAAAPPGRERGLPTYPCRPPAAVSTPRRLQHVALSMVHRRCSSRRAAALFQVRACAMAGIMCNVTSRLVLPWGRRRFRKPLRPARNGSWTRAAPPRCLPALRQRISAARMHMPAFTPRSRHAAPIGKRSIQVCREFDKKRICTPHAPYGAGLAKVHAAPGAICCRDRCRSVLTHGAVSETAHSIV